ncbi:F141 protein [Hirschfeldia incana]|nr:F141 protein [Hirschfeldia incana]
MRRHSAIALRNLFTRSSLRIPQNRSLTSSPVSVIRDVSGRIRSPCSTSGLIRASFSSMTQRRFSTGDSPPDVNKVVDEINLKFAEAREEIEMAMDAKETVYFNEEAECARAAVAEVMEMFEGLLGKVTEKEKSSLQRSMGLKMEQLKAELQQLNE